MLRASSQTSRPRARFEELRPSVRPAALGEGTLACPRCDAPVALGPAGVAPSARLACPFCGHGAPLREFLTLGTPSRPFRVTVRVSVPARS